MAGISFRLFYALSMKPVHVNLVSQQSERSVRSDRNSIFERVGFPTFPALQMMRLIVVFHTAPLS
jgi:hypothetical protein